MNTKIKENLIEEIAVGLDSIANVAVSEEEYTKSLSNIIKMITVLSDEKKLDQEKEITNERIILDKEKFEKQLNFDKEKLEEELQLKKVENEIKIASLNFEKEKFEYDKFKQVEENKIKKLDIILGAAVKGLSIVLPAGVAIFGMTTAMKAEYLDSQRTPSTFKDFWKMITTKL